MYLIILEAKLPLRPDPRHHCGNRGNVIIWIRLFTHSIVASPRRERERVIGDSTW